jgi:hypothetical protein
VSGRYGVSDLVSQSVPRSDIDRSLAPTLDLPLGRRHDAPSRPDVRASRTGTRPGPRIRRRGGRIRRS